jgi:hypothetical protein
MYGLRSEVARPRRQNRQELSATRAPSLAEIVTVGAWFASASSTFQNSTKLESAETQRSPEASKARDPWPRLFAACPNRNEG